MCTKELKLPQQQDENSGFDGWFINALNAGTLMLMISIGHRTGLFDAMAKLEWTDSEELAQKTGLQERYVREWLGAMATGGIAEVDSGNSYRLPARHARYLIRNSKEGNMGVFAQYISVLGAVEDDIVKCFKHGGGVPYEKYRRFHEVMAEDSSMTVMEALEDHILPLVPELTSKLRSGISVLDVGCGRGKALLKLAELFPKSTFRGIDLSEEAIGWALKQVEKRNLKNISFEVRDASDFDKTAEASVYDLVLTFDAIHDQAKPLAVLKGIRKTLKPGGTYLMQDIHSTGRVYKDLEHPLGPTLYTVSCMHCMPVSLAQGGEGLGAMWGREKAMVLLAEAGFEDIRIHQLEHDIQNDYYVMSV